ncbi:DUF6528 family protein [Streptomyces kunmingensis]|uniref:DUF6528 family protein n=1 Tax=Streptomyces kunmingensis TaxID=68225 RepID=A0ABU6CII0_9ACTN|nr:DUF6528 family protein [Streptomyces kunmingensis]MEB3963680.1 DUF6528 family protein [Streptomyces kunmingensis]
MSEASRGPSRRGLLSCAAGAGAGVALGVAGPGQAAGVRLPPVVVTEQASRRILVLDPAAAPWDPAAEPGVVRWAFSPLGDERYRDLKPEVSWVYPSEAKVRRHRGRTFLLTTASFGFVGVVEWPGGRRYWGTAIGPGDDLCNPHTAELLPDGNVAVACSTGARVRLYAASLGPGATRFTEAELKGAHGLHWDRGRRVLWAMGDDELVAYEVAGTAARPRLVRRSADPLPVATPGKSAGGHDLFPVAGRPGRMWVTTGASVFQYEKRGRTFVQDFAGAAEIVRRSVKCVGNDPRTGRVVTTVPEAGLGEAWWTTTVSVHRPQGAYKLVGGGIYKARWWLPT